MAKAAGRERSGDRNGKGGETTNGTEAAA